jgi:hypothetical protein
MGAHEGRRASAQMVGGTRGADGVGMLVFMPRI